MTLYCTTVGTYLMKITGHCSSGSTTNIAIYLLNSDNIRFVKYNNITMIGGMLARRLGCLQ